MPTLRYLTHPQVQIDPAQPVPDWSLNATGTARVAALAASGALRGTTRVISSAETKAIETATPLAAALGCTVEVRAKMHENDRNATGFLPAPTFEAVADAFFRHPTQSVRGWETAQDAQRRIVAAYTNCLRAPGDGDILFVGHGGVGTLLYCHLAGVPISRDFDQIAGGGCVFAWAAPAGRPRSHWRLMETLLPGGGR